MRLVLCLTALCAMGAAIAFGATKTIADKKGDSQKGHPDVKSATFSDTAHTLVFKITAYDTFKTAKAPCVSITKPLKHPPGDLYVTCGDGKIQDFMHGTVAGTAKLSRPNQSTIVYRVPRRLSPTKKALGWEIQVRGCRPDPCDQAPEGPGTHIVQGL